MKILQRILFVFVLLLSTTPIITSAHEVYVLKANEITEALSTNSPNPFTSIPSNEKGFICWGLISILVVLVILNLSISPLFEKLLDPILFRLKKFAPFIVRVTIGISLFASGYYSSLFGPELPLSGLFASNYIGLLLMISGTFILLGLFTRFFSLITLGIFTYALSVYHIYMLMYLDYFGALIFLIIFGDHLFSVGNHLNISRKINSFFNKILHRFDRYAFLILRVCFGLAIFSASFYAKFLNSNLALDTVNDYHLTNYFHFTPLFLVLGAFILEAISGLCIVIGFEIRFVILFLATFLTMSLLFFGEALWPHLILFGLAIAVFCHGYDKYTVEKTLFQRNKKGEPTF